MDTRTQKSPLVARQAVKNKICSECKLEKPIETGFYKSKITKDGHEGKCKECRREISALRKKQKKQLKTIKKPVKKSIAAPAPELLPAPDVIVCPPVVDLDASVRLLFEQTGHGHLYESLEKIAVREMRPVHLQALYLMSENLRTFVIRE